VQNKFTLIQNKAIDKPLEFVILGTLEQDDDVPDMYWNNELGWTRLSHATRFTEEQRIKASLPLGGIWVSLTEMVHSMEMSKANHPTSGFRQPRLTIVDESE
jgi:hypothetical protein